MSQSEFYIPPQGIYFRLLGYVSQCVLFSRTRPDPQVGHIAVKDQFDDQFFTLIPGQGARKGLYAIKGKLSGNVLFSRAGPSPNVGHIGGDGQFEDNWFKIEVGTGQYAKQFRLVTPSAGVALFSRTNAQPFVGNISSKDVFADQYFSFLFEDMKVDKVEYDLKLGKVISSTPIVLVDQVLANNTSRDQELSFTINQTETHTSTFEYSTGFTVTIGTSFSAGIPLVGSTDFSIDVSQSNQWTWGQQNSFSKSYTATFPAKAGPHETIRAISSVNKGDIEVPFKMYLSSKSTGAKAETYGVWRGVSTWHLRHTLSVE